MVCDDRQCLAPEIVDFEINFPKDLDKVAYLNIPEPVKILHPVKWTLKVEDLGSSEYNLIFNAEIDEGWHVYSQYLENDDGPVATSFVFEESDDYVRIGKVIETGNVINSFDSVFEMKVTWVEENGNFTQKIKLSEDEVTIKGHFEFMTCDDRQCIAPEFVDFEVNLPADLDKIAYLNIPEEITIKPLEPPKPLWGIFLAGFLGGLLALITPCVLPMIPLTVGFFTKQSNTKSKGIINSIIYSLSIIVIYVFLGFGVTVLLGSSSAINTIATNPIYNLIFFIVFLLFAISFFGVFEISLPSSWTTKVDAASQKGGLIGIFFMAFTLALVSFSCTGPIIGTLLVKAAEGSSTGPIIGMTGFALALAIPFGLFSAFPRWLNTLPKSGGWLTSVKVVLGFAELALALKFLSNADLVLQLGFLKREIFLIIWILIAVAMSAYLFGLIKFPHDSPIKKLSFPRIGFAVLTLAFAVYLVPGTFCKPLSLVSGFPPPDFYSYQCAGECPHDIACFRDYDEGVAYAQKVGKPIMLDFTGWACVNCRKMEENVWVKPEVLAKIREDYVLISLYVDERTALPASERISKYTGKEIKTVGKKWHDFQKAIYGINSQPYYVLLDHKEKLLNQPVAYTPSVNKYLEFLVEGLEEFEKRKSI
ncbi:MAG: thioredoxin family protein [Bacteroidetes bacterium]|nr:thioredoxin family protein [Bacteroidota bacterium]